MDLVITGALIGAGGAVAGALAAIIPTRATIKAATENTVRTLNAARDDRIWEKRASAYEAALAAILGHANKRSRAMREDAMESRPRLLADYFASYESQSWAETEGRLLAYSSPAVESAFLQSRRAEQAAAVTWDRCHELLEQRDAFDDRPESQRTAGHVIELSDQAEAALGRTVAAVEEALGRDDALIKLIRAELEGSPLRVPGQRQPAEAPRRRHRPLRRVRGIIEAHDRQDAAAPGDRRGP